MTMDQGLISVIIPVFNVEEYLSECLDSVIEQSYSNLDIILIDDGSTDRSGEICDSYACIDNRINVVHKTNCGLSAARNDGLNIAKGKYISFVDSDDFISNDMLECALNSLVEYNADISIINYYRLYANKIVANPYSSSGLFNQNEALKKLIENKEIQDHVCTKLFKAELFDGVQFPTDRIYEDIRTTYKLFLNASSVYVNSSPKYYYRQRKSSIARVVFNENKMQQLDAINEMESNIDNSKYSTLFSIRKSIVCCYLYKDLIQQSIIEQTNRYITFVPQLKNIIKQHFWLLLFKENASCKVCSILALLGYPSSIKILSNKYVNDLIKNRYVFFE